MTGSWADIVAPVNVMENDVVLWNQSSSGYTVPYADLSGNLTQRMTQYFDDEVATCNNGITPKGCATTYLDGSYQGSLAGTGPYAIQSVSQTTGNIILQSNPGYWGGAYQFLGGSKITPQIPTININYVPQESTREIDIQNAAKSGGAVTIDVAPVNLYDVADRPTWLNTGQFKSVLSGVSLYGPYTAYATNLDTFDTNVTNSKTGGYFQFQPFADLRFRLAFADAVNMSEINKDYNNGLGKAAINMVPPGMPPVGAYNESNTPRYSYNLSGTQNLLLQAMQQPLTKFTFRNGTAAPQGFFNNTFGCPTLNSNGQCDSPVSQTIFLNYPTGDLVDQGIALQMAEVVNNISSTYNMGLSVSVVPVPFGQLFTLQVTGQTYWGLVILLPDYPWILDYVTPMFAPGQIFTSFNNFNLTQMATLFAEAQKASASNNVSGLVAITNQMNILSNQIVMYQWTLNPEYFYVMTSNIHGFFYNPSLPMQPTGYYFATMY